MGLTGSFSPTRRTPHAWRRGGREAFAPACLGLPGLLCLGCPTDPPEPPPEADHFECIADTDAPGDGTGSDGGGLQAAEEPGEATDEADETSEGGEGGEALSWDDYASFAVAPAEGGHLIEGDILTTDLGLVARAYAEAVAAFGDGAPSRPSFRSTLACLDDRRDNVWNVREKLALTWCWGEFTSPALFDAVEPAVLEAMQRWESATDVNFIHRADLDGAACDPLTGDVLFDIRQGAPPGFLAAAFFPDEPAQGRSFRLNASAATTDQGIVHVCLHELGHVLGYWHEHARPPADDSAVCLLTGGAPSQWRGVTSPDEASVMGYPFCPGIDEAEQVLSPRDRDGARYTYQLPAASTRFDNNGTNDIFWYRPGEAFFDVWYGMSGAGSPIAFDMESYCYQEAAGLCVTFTPESWKPVVVDLNDAAGRHAVMMYGPGDTVDQLFAPASTGFRRSTLPVQGRTYAPLVGDFSGAGSGPDDIWWVRPGSGADVLWALDGDFEPETIAAYEATTATDSFLNPLVGRFVSGEGIQSERSQVLWWSEHTAAWYLWIASGGLAFEESPLVAIGCEVFEGAPREPLVGDFDDDGGLTEVLWYRPDEGDVVVWDDIPNCEYLTFAAPPDARPFLGDFDGNGADDAFFYRPDSEEHEVWLFGPAFNRQVVDATFVGDASPVVGDFDGDGCDDVLWFMPDEEDNALWRSECDGTFTGQNVTPPSNGFPVGYGRAGR